MNIDAFDRSVNEDRFEIEDKYTFSNVRGPLKKNLNF